MSVYTARDTEQTKMTDTIAQTFDSLKPKQRVKAVIRACMSARDSESGTPTEYIVGRRGKGRFGETLALLPTDGRKPHPMCKIVLHKRTNSEGQVFVSVALGDMGATLVSIEAV